MINFDIHEGVIVIRNEDYIIYVSIITLMIYKISRELLQHNLLDNTFYPIQYKNLLCFLNVDVSSVMTAYQKVLPSSPVAN